MEKHYPKSKAVADLVSPWLPATKHSAGWLSGIAGESSGVRRCSHSSAVEVAHPRRLRSSPSLGISASTYVEHGFQFLASFGSLRCHFCLPVVCPREDPNRERFKLTSRSCGANLVSFLELQRSVFSGRVLNTLARFLLPNGSLIVPKIP